VSPRSTVDDEMQTSVDFVRKQNQAEAVTGNEIDVDDLSKYRGNVDDLSNQSPDVINMCPQSIISNKTSLSTGI
jgi:hypothetical protein